MDTKRIHTEIAAVTARAVIQADDPMQWGRVLADENGAWVTDARYRRTGAAFDWTTTLSVLRAAGATTLSNSEWAELLNISGYLPVGARNWSVESVEPLRPILRKLQRAVRGAYEGELRPQKNPKKITQAELEKRMVSYLKERRCDIPPEGPQRINALRLSVIEAATAEVSTVKGRTLRGVLQSVMPGEPLPEHVQRERSSDEVLRHTLNVFASDISAQLSFGVDGPVVVFTPLNPVVAMLLAAHEQAVKHPQRWAICASPKCGKHFIQSRIDKPTCSERCANYIKRRAYLDKQKTSKSKSVQRRSIVNA